MKAPAFQFYVGDYMQDTRMLSLAARGAWMDLLCAMWRADTRGKISASITGYARLFGCSLEEARAVIDEMIDAQVCDSVTHVDGKVTLSNRRMLREARERDSANLRQKRYRERERRGSDGEDDARRDGGSDAEVTPPSSSSSSTSTTKTDSRRGAEAPPIKQPNVIWDLGVTMLVNAGWVEGNARSFIGKQSKLFGEEALAQAIASTSKKNPANPHEYLVKVLQEHKNGSNRQHRDSVAKPSFTDRAQEYNDHFGVGPAKTGTG